MSSPAGAGLGPRAQLLLRVLTVIRWPLSLLLSVGILGWVIATDDEMVFRGPVHVKLSLHEPLPVSAVVTGIEAPIRTQALQATVKLPDGVRLAAPLEVDVPQLKKPLRADVSGAVVAEVAGDVGVTGAVQAQVSGRVDAAVDGEVTTQITKPIRHERIRVGL
jgi:hypothetical protein